MVKYGVPHAMCATHDQCFLNYPTSILALRKFKHMAQNLVNYSGLLLYTTTLYQLLNYIVTKDIVYKLMWLLNYL